MDENGIFSSRKKFSALDAFDISKQHTAYESLRSKKVFRLCRNLEQEYDNRIRQIELAEKLRITKLTSDEIKMNARQDELTKSRLKLIRRQKELKDKGILSMADLVRHRGPDGKFQRQTMQAFHSGGIPRYLRPYKTVCGTSAQAEQNTNSGAYPVPLDLSSQQISDTLIYNDNKSECFLKMSTGVECKNVADVETQNDATEDDLKYLQKRKRKKIFEKMAHEQLHLQKLVTCFTVSKFS